jgi:5'-3' exonuclease
LFEKENGFGPKEYLYFKAIVGDSSDNIVGVKGAGEATARTFCQTMFRYSLTEALKQCEEGKNARLKKIPEQFDTVTGNLALMDCSYEVLTSEEHEALHGALYYPQQKGTYQDFHELCSKYGFHSLQSESWFAQFSRID